MKIISKDKNTLINLLKNYYNQNENELLKIDEFEKEYSSYKSLWWLTRDSFISKLIFKSFHQKNYSLLFLFRFFIQDIFQQIEQNKSLKSFHVYRSQILSNKQLNLFQNSIGKIFSINSFLFTNLVKKAVSAIPAGLKCETRHNC